MYEGPSMPKNVSSLKHVWCFIALTLNMFLRMSNLTMRFFTQTAQAASLTRKLSLLYSWKDGSLWPSLSQELDRPWSNFYHVHLHCPCAQVRLLALADGVFMLWFSKRSLHGIIWYYMISFHLSHNLNSFHMNNYIVHGLCACR